MPSISEFEFNQIVQDLKPHQRLAVCFSKDRTYGIQFQGFRPRFEIERIKEIGDRIRSFDSDKNTAVLASEYNKLLDQVHLRHSRSMYDLTKILETDPLLSLR